MLAKVQSSLKKLRKTDEPLLVGVSGGADSVALLHALVELGYRPHVCHLNHRWRGAASDADAEFVRQLAKQLGLPVTIGRLPSVVVGGVSNPDRRRGKSRLKTAPTEDSARRARFAFFERVAKKTGIGTLVLAHTADDQAETFLMRLLRGAGTTGLSGIWPERRIGKLRVLRPMLNVSRKEVLKYIAARKLKFREDASNADRRFLRNRIRHELLPLLERDYNPGIRDVLRRTAEIFRAEVERDPVASERRKIRRELGSLSFRQVEELRKQPQQLTERFDADVLGEPLTVRTWRPGDRFQPLGMNGTKKLQDFFVDAKVPREERTRVPLLCAADGRIAWVVGYRIAEPFKVTERTRRVLCVRCSRRSRARQPD
jgi:tRNA(Ile)-lysidine synthase